MKNFNKLKFPELEIGQVFTLKSGSTWRVILPINNRELKSGIALCLTHSSECMINHEMAFKVNENVFMPK